MTQRLPDWEARLGAFLEERAREPFLWGHNDCALFCADAIEAITGVDPAPEFRGRYRTEAGSKRALAKYGKGTLGRTFDAKFERIPPAFAQRGDVVMVDGMVGICVGADAVFVGEEVEAGASSGTPALLRWPRASWRRAWKVARV